MTVGNNKRNTQVGAPKKIKDWRTTRENETIGGGHFVFRRCSGSGRIRPPEWPFEHPSYQAAVAEAVRLARLYPGERFEVVSTQFTQQEAIDGAA